MAERSPRKYPRKLRVNEVVRETIADHLERMEDPRLELVTITGVDVSPDLRHANVFYGTLGRKDPEIAEAFEAASKPLRAALGREVRLKYVPALHFREDPAIEAGQRVEEILRGLHEQKKRR
ncbi:MAG: 30S ribosome-binding factor RbfA [Acidimicrobiia bacterium]|jgi:ribosome-binding factor A